MAVACLEMLVTAASSSCTFLMLGMVWSELPAWDRARVADCQKMEKSKGEQTDKDPFERQRAAPRHSEARGRAPMLGRYLARGTVAAWSTNLCA